MLQSSELVENIDFNNILYNYHDKLFQLISHPDADLRYLAVCIVIESADSLVRTRDELAQLWDAYSGLIGYHRDAPNHIFFNEHDHDDWVFDVPGEEFMMKCFKAIDLGNYEASHYALTALKHWFEDEPIPGL